MQANDVLAALASGRSIRRSKWEQSTRMFVKDNTLVCQRGTGPLYPYDLGWSEIVAKDWQLA